MMNLKRFFTISMAILICLLSSITALAANQKSSLSDYADKGCLKVREELLHSFDSIEKITETAESYYFDSNDKKEGNACYAAKLNGSDRKYLFTISNFGKTINLQNNKTQRVTLKLWIYISNPANIKADHEDSYDNDYSDTSTIYFRATNGDNTVFHSMNHTVLGSGWQEIELDYSISYSVSDALDLTKISGCYMFAYVKGPVTIKVDDLRVCYYSNDGYTSDTSDIIDGARIISTCDYDSLDGALVNEWFDSDFSEEIKHSGSSSVHSLCNGGDDQRIYFANNNIDIDKDNDYLCFWMYIDNFNNLKGLFIEANENQDIHEYTILNCLDRFYIYAKTTTYNNNWFMVQIPFTMMEEHLSKDLGNTVTLKNLRMLATPKDNKEVNVYIDSVFVATRNQVVNYNNSGKNEQSSDKSSNASLTDASTSSNVTNNNEHTNLILYIAIIGGAVLLISTIVTIAIIIKKRAKNKD